ncbi:putative disease resistance RPP13-like protein 1 [Humulus lupulus]|uniref:putative disease resistance RPP13-like protein 1 n=1 Tax=Humulus lupulus TaxID=3486 RepID=UPI002B4173E0|nr:putative disease resistance RPP13-like protein 1 [Humulus lupulus]
MEFVVGPVVSASIEFLLKKIASSDVASFLRGKKKSGFDRLLDKLETTFFSLAEVLGDAEQKQFRNPTVEKWLDKLHDAVEDAEDLFDEIEYDALKLKVEAESEPDKTKVRKLFSSFSSSDQDRKMDMNRILERLKVFEKQRYILNLQKGVEKIRSHRPPSISSIEYSEFFGRDDEKKVLKGKLLSEEVGSKKICVIPIVGLGGIGKTNLAQAVYNDDEVHKHFELKAWVCVSDEFDVCKVTKTVLVAITRDACAVEDLSVLQEKIQERLKKKKFLIVLDDVWNEEYNFWDTMRMVFKVGSQGSKIIVTTRSEKVGSIMGTTGSCHLNVLKEEACFKLFVKLVFDNEEFAADSDLGRICKELVKKCKGLPLAVKAIASLLRFTNVKEWKRIAKSDIFYLPVGEKNILPALRLSYHYLPSHLKRCFLYCSLFPKDYLFKKEDLILLWMADNLLEHSSGNRTMEEVGYEYFDDLVSRSFFQPASNTYTRDRFVMHDLMVDLANFVATKKFVYIKKDKPYEVGLMRQTRHIAFDRENQHIFHDIFKSISEATCLRTFLPVTHYLSSTTSQEDVFKDLSKLRHLSLNAYEGVNEYEDVNEFPKSKGELRHLRYLNLSHSPIKELPESLCMWYKLQTLKLIGCKNLTKFPKNLHHLINLRYLDMSYCKFCTLPPLGQLPSLKTLSIEECDAVEMVGLHFYGTSPSKSFPSLQSLRFGGMSKWKEWSMPEANVEVFPKLTSLSLGVCKRLTGELPRLLPSLTELRIFLCPQLTSSLPMMPFVTTVWIGRCEKIAGFKSWSSLLPPYKYESLQKLSISGSFNVLPLDSFPNIRNVEVFNCRNFESLSLSNSLKSLSTLSIEQCPNFTLLPNSNLDCPILTLLHLLSCNKLQFLPEPLSSLLPSLQELVIDGCPELESLTESWLPFSLRELTIENCVKVIKSRKNWNLQVLPNLTTFRIGDYKGEDMDSFLEQELLPTSLTSLQIDGIACLKTLDDKGFRKLTSLKELRIFDCHNLKTLPVKGLPPSFEGFLPPSFESFIIYRCPLLEAKYEWEKEGLFKKITCIPLPQAPMGRQWLLIKPSLTLFGPEALLFRIALSLLCIYLYMLFNL